jgi:hypothetical protein
VLALIGSGATFLWSQYRGTHDDFAIKSEAAPQVVSLKVFDEYNRQYQETAAL